jgi:long-chain acyl-CoA synthetase
MEAKPWYRSYPPQVPKVVTYEKLTVPQALSRTAKRFPNRPALNFMGNRITYRRFEEMVNRFSGALLDLGIQKGDKVALALPNLPQTIIANMAIMRIGAVAVQNNPLYTERELAHQLNDSDSKIIITLTLLVPRIEKIKSQTKIKKIIACNINTYLPPLKRILFPYVKKTMYKKITPTEDVIPFEACMAGRPKSTPVDQSRWEDLGALIYTGGTTGVSKGVMLSHANLSSNVQQVVAWIHILEPGKDSMVGTFPAFHSAGFTVGQNLCIWLGLEHHIIPRPEAEGIVDIIRKYKPTVVPAVPTIFVGLLNNPRFRSMDLSFIKGFGSGAAPLAAETIRDLTAITGGVVFEAYGLTETTCFCTMTPIGGVVKAGTVGVPVCNTDIRIVDLETGKKDAPSEQPGEIIIRGPQLMTGYYKRDDETKKVVRDGWFYTGDIGVFDEDGYLTIVDRRKDLIIASGYNIYPVELDGILMSHPKILEACCIGVPDGYRGETVKAFVVVKPGESLSEQEVKDYCKKQLAAYKIPKIIEFIDDLPKSGVGKILRRKLKEMEQEKTGKK